jgi:DNA-binding transcriptional ArsR family regulator
MATEEIPTEPRVIDLDGLKALAHPLRVRLVDTLSTYGPATASGLAERLGESSGATSYHLRQLEKHGFVREVEGRGTARERWWERVPGSMQIGAPETRATPAGRSASRLVEREFLAHREALLHDFLERGQDELPEEWRESGGISLLNLQLTAEQFAQAADELEALQTDFAKRWRGQKMPGARPVQLQINVFPVVDGTPQE